MIKTYVFSKNIKNGKQILLFYSLNQKTANNAQKLLFYVFNKYTERYNCDKILSLHEQIQKICFFLHGPKRILQIAALHEKLFYLL